ncbi:hypothetical protein C8J57DRAFT_1721309 [Mycena rebaudengoi]|nr:hypothetical protein C8J57DRAFT_1721309 [Mycena rebaudengoi]
MVAHNAPILPIATLVLITLLHMFAASSSFRTMKRMSGGHEKDIPDRLPLLPQPVALVVEATNRYGLEAEEEWSSLMPHGKGFGFVRLGAQGRPLEPAIYHQLHCLSSLRKSFAYGSRNMTSERAAWHIHHCLNYLRQAILCNADTTLEPSYMYVLKDNTTTPAASGLGVTHTCVDWTQIRVYVDENQDLYRNIPLKLST